LHPLGLVAQGAVHEFREVHLGMEVRLAIVAEAVIAPTVARRAYDRIDSLSAILSDWNPRSELRQLESSAVGEWVPLSHPLVEVLALALDVADATSGAFDPTVGPLTRLWREAARTGIPATDAAVQVARARVGYQHVELDTVRQRVRLHREGLQFDLGAVAKGWILDAALAGLRADGITAALIEAGGDLVMLGHPPGARGWRIAYRGIHGETVTLGTGGAISTSGPSVQWIPAPDGERESHVMDVTTGRGVSRDLEITVFGDRAAITDALATALTLVPPAQRQELAIRYRVTYVEGRLVP
jgi:thiamine biosynthesis lipoprotein